jgi:hypothetical protein
MRKILNLWIFVFLFCSACKKDNSSQPTIGSIDIADANMLIFGSIVIDPYSGNEVSDSLKLYKLTNANEIHPVLFLSADNSDLKSEFVTDGIYNLNTGYFLFNVYHKSDVSKKIESYIINKFDGTAQQLASPVVPACFLGNGWVKGSYSAGFLSSDSNTIFIPDGEKINRLDIDNNGEGSIQTILLNSPYFDADTSENILCGNTLVLADKTQIPVPEIPEGSYIVRQSDPGFNVVTLETDTVRIKKLDISSNSYSISDRYKINTRTTLWNYLGNASIGNLKGSCLVFDKAILYIDADVSYLVSLTELALKQIKGFYVSENALFINGVNNVSKEVFLKINPKPEIASYTDVFPPDYSYYHIQVSGDGGLSFNAKQVIGTIKEIIGFQSASKTIRIVDNDYGIKVKQVLTLK